MSAQPVHGLPGRRRVRRVSGDYRLIAALDDNGDPRATTGRGTGRRRRTGGTTPATRTPEDVYVIARCYSGDTPPRADTLPPGCSVADVRRIDPR